MQRLQNSVFRYESDHGNEAKLLRQNSNLS